MAKKLGIVMDPIAAINVKKDTSFKMLLTAQERGYDIFYMTLDSLYVAKGQAYANVQLLQVVDDQQHWFELQPEEAIPLAELNVILMRKDPPFNMEYIYATYILELAEAAGTLIVNKPQSLRDANEKMYTTWFAEFMPTTLISRNQQQIKQFITEQGTAIIKPLDGMGGSSIFKLTMNDPNTNVIIETLTNYQQCYAMVQAFIPEITEGDKRVLLIDGEPIPYCLARIPAQGENRGNLAAGGHGEVRPLSESDKKIAAVVGKQVRAKGLLFVGLDIIGDKLTEVNVTSPTCVREIEAAQGIDITGKLFDTIERKLAESL